MLNKTKILLVCGTFMTTEQNSDTPIPDLKTARQNSGWTLKEMFERTRISAVNLEAIENGQFHLLPVPIYTRNFIKTYAQALGVDSRPTLKRYEEYLQALKNKEREQAAVKPPPAPLAEMLSRHKIFLSVASMVILIAAVSIFASLYNKPSSESRQGIERPGKQAVVVQTAPGSGDLPAGIGLPKPEDLTGVRPPGGEPVTASPSVQTSAVPETAASQKAPEKGKSAPAQAGAEETSLLIIRATEQTWIRMQVDEKEPYEVLLEAGETLSQKASRFNMDIGNAGGIRIQLDGKTIENLGKSGQVIHLRLP